MDKKHLMATPGVLHNVSVKYPDTAQYIKENINELCQREKLSVEVVFYFVVFG